MYLVWWLVQCPLVVELHVVVDELCCYQEQDYNHWYDPTHRCAFGVRPVLGRLDVFTPVEVVLGHFWNYWKILSYASLMTSKYVCNWKFSIISRVHGQIISMARQGLLLGLIGFSLLTIHRVIHSKIDKLKCSVFQNLEYKMYSIFFF